jgi:hypothetical protein
VVPALHASSYTRGIWKRRMDLIRAKNATLPKRGHCRPAKSAGRQARSQGQSRSNPRESASHKHP